MRWMQNWDRCQQGQRAGAVGAASPAATAAASEGNASSTGSSGHRVLVQAGLQQPIPTSFPARASQEPMRVRGSGGSGDPAHHTWLHRAMKSCSSALPCPQHEGTSLLPTPAAAAACWDGAVGSSWAGGGLSLLFWCSRHVLWQVLLSGTPRHH